MSLNTWNHRRKAFILQMSFVCRVGYMNIEVCVCWGTCAMVRYICHAGVCEPCWSLCTRVCVCWSRCAVWGMCVLGCVAVLGYVCHVGVCVLGCVCSVGMCICWVHVPCGPCQLTCLRVGQSGERSTLAGLILRSSSPWSFLSASWLAFLSCCVYCPRQW